MDDNRPPPFFGGMVEQRYPDVFVMSVHIKVDRSAFYCYQQVRVDYHVKKMPGAFKHLPLLRLPIQRCYQIDIPFAKAALDEFLNDDIFRRECSGLRCRIFCALGRN